VKSESTPGSDPTPGADPALLKRLRDILSVPGNRVGTARRLTAAIRETEGFRWVGIYDAGGTLMAWAGDGSADRPSEKAIPVRGPAGSIVGWLETERPEPWLKACAAMLAPLWA